MMRLSTAFLTLALLIPALQVAAEPTPDQVAAIKSNCRSDFLSKCSGVPRGGSEAMQCLKNNFASVSAGCQQALKPLMAAAPPKAPAPAPAVAKPESAPAPQPSTEATAKPAAPSAPATQETKPATAATTPPSAPASEPAPASPPKAAAKTPATETAPAATAKEPAASPPVKEAVAPPAAPEEAPVIIGRIPPRKKLMILKNCRQDLDTHCAGVDYGEGRQLSCLFSKKASLTPDCQGALAKLTN